MSSARPAGPARGVPGESFAPPKDDELRAIIVEGDPVQLVTVAERVGRELARPGGNPRSTDALATSQIRSVFGKVRELDMQTRTLPSDVRDLTPEIYRELQLLRPKLAYQAARVPGRGVRWLKETLEPAIVLVGRDRQRFQHFVDFFEAILAYHKAYGGQ
ncbi:MAG: type III-A CRISPR-associated protein Csm2 [Thermomicrobium sp.]|nr:type III-A CRISPR-associated protein Csm2 [Thermomicrobium sp.]MDW8060804.1 type III-A CRISPR-associated protein Csm2 [Thermomicrobium sp.]